MGFWKNLGQTALTQSTAAAQKLQKKNQRAATANRLRTVIRCEEKAAEKEYLALGRYYYNALRNSDNPIAEAHCARIDAIQARRDKALEDLEQVVQERQADDVIVFDETDGPTAVFVTEHKKKNTLFHFDRGPIEITVTRDSVFDPEDENSEEIDLSDVQSYEQDPMPEETPSPAICPEIQETIQAESTDVPQMQPAAELDENDSLPFE